MAVISTPQPHVFIIPGAWHPAHTMDPFAKALEAAGFSATVVPTRSVGNRDVTVQDDEAQAKTLLLPILDEGKDVIVLGHSYGGFVISGLIAGLDKKSREAQGLKGGIIGVIYLSAFVPIEGETTSAAVGPDGRQCEYCPS
jgi:pimeloyl-ACP methyl ester carboxylesterase